MAEQTRRRRSAAVALGITGLLAAGLTGYAVGQDDDEAEEVDYAAVCVDSQTEQRVEDGSCDEGGEQRFYGGGGGFYGWYFLPVGGRAPGIGQRVAGGTLTAPPGRVARGGIDRAGGTVSRGGFGVNGRAGGSGG